jgi:DNA-binding phage protein
MISKKLNNIGQIIKGVNTMTTTKSYHQYLIESLKQPTEAAAYLWAILQEENPEPQLLKSALEDILEALGSTQLSPEEIEQQKDKLNILLEQQGKVAIYSLGEWLQKLGLELTVKAKDETFVEQNNSEINSKVMI